MSEKKNAVRTMEHDKLETKKQITMSTKGGEH